MSPRLEFWLTWIAAGAAGAVLSGIFDMLVIVPLGHGLEGVADRPSMIGVASSVAFAGALLNANLTAVCQAFAFSGRFDEGGSWVAFTAAGSATGWVLLVSLAGLVSAPHGWFTSAELPLVEGIGLAGIGLTAALAQAVVLRRNGLPISAWLIASTLGALALGAVAALPVLTGGGLTVLLLARVAGGAVAGAIGGVVISRLLVPPAPR